MIAGFKDGETELVWNGTVSLKLPREIQQRARLKLRLLNNAASLLDLKAPPGNQLEALKDDRKGQHSIRINQQWRVCFVWREGTAHEVEITDYH